MAFSTQPNFLWESLKILHMSVCFFLFLSSIYSFMGLAVFLTICLFKDLAVYSLGLLWVKLLWIATCSFLVKTSFRFSGISANSSVSFFTVEFQSSVHIPDMPLFPSSTRDRHQLTACGSVSGVFISRFCFRSLKLCHRCTAVENPGLLVGWSFIGVWNPSSRLVTLFALSQILCLHFAVVLLSTSMSLNSKWISYKEHSWVMFF